MPYWACYPLALRVHCEFTLVREIRQNIAERLGVLVVTVVIFEGENLLMDSQRVDLDAELHGGIKSIECGHKFCEYTNKC